MAGYVPPDAENSTLGSATAAGFKIHVRSTDSELPKDAISCSREALPRILKLLLANDTMAAQK